MWDLSSCTGDEQKLGIGRQCPCSCYIQGWFKKKYTPIKQLQIFHYSTPSSIRLIGTCNQSQQESAYTRIHIHIHTVYSLKNKERYM